MKLENNKVYMFFAKLIFDIVSIIVPAIVAVCLVFTFCFRTAGVDGSSMNPTLINADRLIITAGIGSVTNGDIVVSSQPNILEKTLIKRVIAVEGQTIDIDFEQGVVYVDGVALDEPYIAAPTRERLDFRGPVTIPEGYVFLMGDNRNRSTDSRSNQVGLIDENYIMGRVLFRFLPFGSFEVNN